MVLTECVRLDARVHSLHRVHDYRPPGARSHHGLVTGCVHDGGGCGCDEVRDGGKEWEEEGGREGDDWDG